jgi:hypothetical protein
VASGCGAGVKEHRRSEAAEVRSITSNNVLRVIILATIRLGYKSFGPVPQNIVEDKVVARLLGSDLVESPTEEVSLIVLAAVAEIGVLLGRSGGVGPDPQPISAIRAPGISAEMAGQDIAEGLVPAGAFL